MGLGNPRILEKVSLGKVSGCGFTRWNSASLGRGLRAFCLVSLDFAVVVNSGRAKVHSWRVALDAFSRD